MRSSAILVACACLLGCGTADPEPAPTSACDGVVCVADLPASFSGTTAGASRSRFDAYGCSDLSLGGAEVVYRVPVRQQGFFLAATTGGGTVLRLLRSLDPLDCVDAHATAVAGFLDVGDYYVVVDSQEGGGGDYTLRMALTTAATFEASGVGAELAADALIVLRNAWAWGATRRPEYVLVDFTRHSAVPREWIFDLSTGELLWHLRVAHGHLSTDGVDLAHAQTFSNVSGSNQSSLGLLRAAGPYVGTFGPSIRLEGLEPGFNDNVCARDIVMHPWAPMGDEYVNRCGWARPSLGCPAIDSELSLPVRDRLARPDGAPLDQGVAMLFWFPGTAWHAQSPYLRDPSPNTGVTAQLGVECDSSTDGVPTPPASTDYACD